MKKNSIIRKVFKAIAFFRGKNMIKIISLALIVVFMATFLPFSMISITNKAIAAGEQQPWVSGVNFGVQNSPLGSRFSLNMHADSARKRSWSSTMGSQIDDSTSFIVASRLNSDGSIKRFAPSDQWYPEYSDGRIELWPDRQILSGTHCNFAGNASLFVSSSTISPFLPVESLNDPDLKTSTMPAFYQNVSFYNPTSTVQVGQMLVSLDYAFAYKQIGDTKIIYYRTSADRNTGIRALAIKGSSASWGIGDSLFDFFATNGYLPNRHIGDSNWNPGGFALPFSLRPGESMTKTLVYAGYNNGTAMFDNRINKGLKFWYTKYFGNVESVVDYAFGNYQNIINATTSFSKSLMTGNSALDLVTAQGIHSYKGDSWLVYNPADGLPRYYVSEGDCQYLSTIDVAYDIAPFEAEYFPYFLRLQLEEWSQYVFYDSYGACLYHDMGWRDKICTQQQYPSLMGIEENVDYICMLYLYWQKTGDLEFLKSKIGLISKLLDSLRRRDTNGDGIVDTAGYNTTFDFDNGKSAIGIADNNVNIGMKEFVSFLFAVRMYQATKTNGVDGCRQTANIICQRMKGVHRDCGYLPVSLSLSLPAASDHTIVNFDAFLYVFLTDFQDPLVEDMLCNTASSHANGMINCQTVNGYRLTSSAPCIWISKSFNAKLENDYLCARGHYAVEEGIISKSKTLVAKSAQGFTDYWSMDGNTSMLILYPRGVAAITSVQMIPKMIDFLYSRWLDRKPDPEGRQNFLRGFRSGLSVNQAKDSFQRSDEYAQRIIKKAYRELLFREPDQGGRAVYTEAIKNGMSEDQLRASIMGSDEYHRKHP